MDLVKFRDESFMKLADLGYIEVPSNVISQLAGSKIFEDKIMQLKRKEAKESFQTDVNCILPSANQILSPRTPANNRTTLKQQF